MSNRRLFFPCEVGADARHQRRSSFHRLLDSLALCPKGMARNPRETHLTEGRDLLLPQPTAPGIRAAGCSCNNMELPASWVCCLLRFAICHLVTLEVMLYILLSGCTIMTTGLNADPLAREWLQATWLALQVVSTLTTPETDTSLDIYDAAICPLLAPLPDLCCMPGQRLPSRLPAASAETGHGNLIL